MNLSSSRTGDKPGEAEADQDFMIFDDPNIRILLVLLYTIVFFFCFFGNLAVLLVTTCNWKLRSVTKFCLSNLAFANLCVGIFCVYQNLSVYLYPGWVFGEILCRMYHFTDSLSHSSSIFILVVISVERYVVILHPYRWRQILTIQRLRLVIIGVWVLSAVISSPKLYYMSTVESPFLPRSEGTGEPQMMCVPRVSLYDVRTADMIQFLTLFAIPLTIISILYGRVASFLRKKESVCSRNSSRSSRPYYNKETPSCTTPGSSATPSSETHQQGGSSSGGSNKRGNKSRRFSDRNFNHDETEAHHTEIRCYLRGNSHSCVICEDESVHCNEEDASSKVPISEGRAEEGGGEEEDETIFDKFNNKKFQTPKKTFMKPSTMIRIEFSKVEEGARNNYKTRVTSIPSPHRAVARLLITIVVAFAAFNLPFYLRKFYQNYILSSAELDEEDSDWIELLTPITYLMMYSNCAINPFLYGIMSKSFRRSFLNFVKCNCNQDGLGIDVNLP